MNRIQFREHINKTNRHVNMKNHKVELLIILIISIGGALLLPNYFKGRDTILIVPSEFSISFLVTFIPLAALFFSNKPKEKLASIPDGYQKLYNEKSQVTKEGVFKGGKLFDGSKHVYTKDGTLSHIEIYKNGIYIKDNNLSADT
jgi:hypothetical protein